MITLVQALSDHNKWMIAIAINGSLLQWASLLAIWRDDLKPPKVIILSEIKLGGAQGTTFLTRKNIHDSEIIYRLKVCSIIDDNLQGSIKGAFSY